MKWVAGWRRMISSEQFLMFWLAYGMIGVVANSWQQNVTYTILNACIMAMNFLSVIARRRSPEIVSINVPSIVNPETIMELDERLAAVGRAFGREPTADEMRVAVQDLRSIVKELSPGANPGSSVAP